MIEVYKQIQELNGRLGGFYLDDYTTVFTPYTKDTIENIINDLKIEINLITENASSEQIVITESLATYIIDNVDPTFFDNLSCFNIVEDIGITNARIEDEVPYYQVHLDLKISDYEFKPKPRKIEVNWNKLAEIDLGKSVQQLLIDEAAKQIKKATGIPPSYLS